MTVKRQSNELVTWLNDYIFILNNKHNVINIISESKMKSENTLLLYYLQSSICKIHKSGEVDFSNNLPCNDKKPSNVSSYSSECCIIVTKNNLTI